LSVDSPAAPGTEQIVGARAQPPPPLMLPVLLARCP